MSAKDRAAGPAGETGGRKETGNTNCYIWALQLMRDVTTEVLVLTHLPDFYRGV